MIRRLALALLALPMAALGQYNITGSSPVTISAGTQTATMQLFGTFPDPTLFNSLGYKVCVYSGTTNGYTPLAATNETTSEIDVVIPDANLELNPTLFNNGQYNLVTFVSAAGGSCATPNTQFSIPVMYPSFTNENIFAYPAPSSAAQHTYPNKIELYGNNFLARGIAGAAGSSYFQVSPATPITSLSTTIANDGQTGTVMVTLPTAIAAGEADMNVVACNASPQGTYAYCNTANPIGGGYFSLSPTSVDTSNNISSIYTGNSAVLSATISTTGSGSNTDGGQYIVPAPGGTVTFTDGTTTLGTVSAVSTQLGLHAVALYPLSVEPPSATYNNLPSFNVDLNADGAPDVVLLEPQVRRLHVYFGGSPTGNLQNGVLIDLSQSGNCSATPSVTFGDLNQDGFTDIVYSCTDSSGASSIYYMLNLGDGTFKNPVAINAYGEQVAIADVNADGTPDIVVAGLLAPNGSYGFQVYLGAGFGTGTGVFNAQTAVPTGDSAGTILQIAAQDLNHDTYPDLVILHYNPNAQFTVADVYQNNQQNAFNLQNTLELANSQIVNGRLWITPLNGSTAYPDILVIANDSTPTAYAAINKQFSTVNFSGGAIPTTFTNTTSFAVGDYNGDGKTDIATSTTSEVDVHLSDGSGSFPNTTTPLYGSDLLVISGQDLNVDGLADLVAIASDYNSIETFLADGTTSVQLSTGFTTTGTHTITATYNGSPSVYGSSGTITINVANAPLADVAVSTTPGGAAMTSASQVYAAGAKLSLNFKVSKDSNDTRDIGGPTGTITLTENSATVGTAYLTQGYGGNSSTAMAPNFENATTGTHTITVAYSGDSNYGGSSQVFTYTVTQQTPVITWATPASIPYGTALSGTQLNATAADASGNAVAGSFTYSPTAGTVLPVGNTQLSLSFIPTDTTDFNSNGGQYVTVNQKVDADTTTTTLSAPTSVTYPNTLTLSATVATQVPSTINGSVIFTVNGTTVGSAQPSQNVATVNVDTHNPAWVDGSNTVVATLVQTGIYASSSDTKSVTMVGATPTINWPAAANVAAGTALSFAQLNAVAQDINGNALSGTYTYTPASGTVLSAGLTQLSVLYTPDAASAVHYGTATASHNIDALPPSTVSVTASPNPVILQNQTTLTATVSSASGIPTGSVTFYEGQTQLGTGNLVAGTSNATATGAYTPTTAGTHTITARYSGDTNTFQGSGSVNVAAQSPAPTITWNPTITSIAYGTALSSAELNATTTIPGTFTYSPASGTVLPPNANTTLSVLFTPTDTTVASGSATTTIAVTQATPVITWATPSSIPYGTQLSSTQLNAVAKDASGNTLPGNFSYSPQAGAVLPVGNTQLSLSFIPTDTTDYTSTGGQNVHVTQNVTADTSSTTLTLGSSTATYGDQVSLSATVSTQIAGTLTGGSVTFTANGTTVGQAQVVSGVASTTASTQNPAFVIGSNSIVATLTGTTNYASSSDTKSLSLSKATPKISWPNPANVAAGSTLTSVQLDAVAQDASGNTLSGTYVYSPAAGSTVVQGGNSLSVTFTPDTATSAHFNTAVGGAEITALPPSTVTVAATPNPAIVQTSVSLTATVSSTGGIPTGTVTFYDGQTKLSVMDLTAGTSNSTATIQYTPTTTGSHSINAIYSGSSTIFSNSGTTSLSVSVPPPTITWTPAVTSIPYGTPLSASELNATTTVPGVFTYTPASGTILPVNPQTALGVTFVPTDTTIPSNSASTTIAVTLAPTVTAFSINPTTANYGDSLGISATVTATPTNTINGTITFTETRSGQTIATTTVSNGAASATISTTNTNFSIGSNSITATFQPTTQFASSSSSQGFTLNKATATLTYNPTPASIAYGTALVASQLNASSTVPGSFTYSQAVGDILSTGSHTITANFTPTDTTHYATGTKQGTISVSQITPTISWATPANIDAGTPLTSTQLNATAKGINNAVIPGTFVYSPAAGSVPASGIQTLNVAFTPTDSVNYTTATGSVQLDVVIPPTSTTFSVSGAPLVYGKTAVLNSTISSSSGTQVITGTVSFSISGTIYGPVAVVHDPQTGNYTATLSTTAIPAGFQSGVATYSGDSINGSSTSTSTQTGPFAFLVQKAPLSLNWTPTVATIPYGTALSASQLNATATSQYIASVPASITYSPTLGTVLSAGPQTLTATVTPTDTNDFSTGAGSTQITVTQATPTISWPTPAAITPATPLSAAQLNATATGVGGVALPGTFTYTPAAGSTLTSGSHTLSVTFTPTDTVDYIATTATTTISVLNTASTTTIASSINPSQFGQATVLTSTVVPNVSSDHAIAGTITFYDGQTQIGQPVGLVVNAQTGLMTATLSVATLGAGSHTLTATYSGDDYYATSTSAVPVTQVVNTSPVTLSWTPTVATIPYGTALSAAQLDAVATSPFVASVPANIVYSPALGTVLSAGQQTLTATVTPTDTADFTAGAGSAIITVTKATPVVSWTTPASIIQGAPLTATQLNATATGLNQQALPGTFIYTPALGAILPSGPNTLNVSFTPTDATDYAIQTGSVILNVSIPAAKITITSPTNPSQYGQSTTLTATLTPGGTLTALPTGSVTFSDSGKAIGTANLTAGIATLPISTLTTGQHIITATYGGDTANATATSTAIAQTVTQAPSLVTFAPAPASIVYGTALTAAQLDATATSAYVATVPGAFTYTPALGTVLTAATQSLSVTFTPTDTVNFSTVTKTAALTVTKATPTVTFPNPADTIVGTKLSAAQLAATATGVTNATLPGVFVYTPAAGSLVTSGAQTLSVTFTPTDTTNYTTQTATATLNGIPVTLTTLSATTAALGDAAKTITVTGTGFATDSTVRVNGTAIATTYVSGTSLQATIPATSFTAVATLQVTVYNPTQLQTTAALPFTVTAPPVTINVTAPGTTTPTSQPTIGFTLNNPYPVPVTGTFTITFQSGASDGANDPNIVFALSGTRTLSFTIPAGQTSITGSTAIQAGTIAGNIVITLTLQAGGINVTPAGTTPVTINIPAVAPGITSVDPVVRSGKNLTVTVNGYSNTHQATTATFHFTPIAGKTLTTSDITVNIASIFAAWYASAASSTYGSAFGYDQPFTLDDDASIIASVTVTLDNSVGASVTGSTQ